MEFKDSKVDEILEEYGVEIKFDTPREREMNPHWMMIWEDKHIRFTDFDKREMEPVVKRVAALFTYLYQSGVDVTIAQRCAEAYVRVWKIYSWNKPNED